MHHLLPLKPLCSLASCENYNFIIEGTSEANIIRTFSDVLEKEESALDVCSCSCSCSSCTGPCLLQPARAC